MRKVVLLILVAFVGIGAGYTVRGAARRIASGGVHSSLEKHLKAEAAPEARQPSGDNNAPVIRFVKNPEMAPALPEHDISGAPLSLANWSGKVIFVNFWATWCPPCREEIPELIALQKQYGSNLQIVGISEDDDPAANVLKFANQHGINYPIVMATPEVIAAYGGVPALPTTFVIDTQGRVVQKHAGLHPMDSYVREIRALLGHPVDARIETYVDTGQLFLKNAVNATELPGVNLDGLTPEQKKAALHRLNAESCTCGCALTLSQCRVNDTECPVSGDMAAKVVKEVVRGGKPARSRVQPTSKAPQS
jgi:thiol-disulfide isomerase/thioredoxin